MILSKGMAYFLVGPLGVGRTDYDVNFSSPRPSIFIVWTFCSERMACAGAGQAKPQRQEYCECHIKSPALLY